MLYFTRASAKGLLSALLLACVGLTPARASFTNLHDFSANYNSGAYPVGKLAVRNGVLYGVTRYGNNGHGGAFKMTTAGAVTNLVNFAGGATNPSLPNAGLVYDPATDAFYGTSINGGTDNQGTVFKMTPAGVVTILHSFTGYDSGNPAASDGDGPYAGLLLASDGNLYGVTYQGGEFNEGTIFKITTGGTYTLLKSVEDSVDGVRLLFTGLAEGTDGMLYGASYYSPGVNGAIYKINKNGTGFGLVHTFPSNDPAGHNPYSDLIRASDGHLYGTCLSGGTNNLGTVYRVNTSTSAVTPLWVFDGFTGGTPANNYANSPQYRLLQGSDGKLYGTSREGGYYGYGTAFKLTLTGDCTVLTHFNQADAREFANPLTQIGSNFYCTSFYGGLSGTLESTDGYGAAMQIKASGALTVIHSFFLRDGYTSYGGLIQNGTKYYGVCYYGGAYGHGLIFEITAGGAFKIIHHLNNYLQEGYYPAGGLVKGPGTDKNMYGTTTSGGRYGHGTIFKVTTTGKFTVLHHFRYQEGYYPTSRLLVGTDKNLYGTCYYGGAAAVGSIFCVDRAGQKYKTIHHFANLDGRYPSCTLAQDPVSKRLYGTAHQGGANNLGTVYSLKTDGSGFMVLHNFTSASSGPYHPYYAGPLVLSGGFLYGVTYYGGTSGHGAIFKTNVSTGATTAFFNFNNSSGHGANPTGGLFLAGDGFFYGTCLNGGSSGAGTIWKVNATTAAFTLLKALVGATDGNDPFGGVIRGTDGQLYGTTYTGGANNVGTIFQQSTTP